MKQRRKHALKCDCWIQYPNENHKRSNGNWKCELYDFVKYSKYGKTICKLKEEFVKE